MLNVELNLLKPDSPFNIQNLTFKIVLFGLQYYKPYSNAVEFARLTAGIFMYPAFELLFGVCCVALLYGWEFYSASHCCGKNELLVLTQADTRFKVWIDISLLVRA